MTTSLRDAAENQLLALCTFTDFEMVQHCIMLAKFAEYLENIEMLYDLRLNEICRTLRDLDQAVGKGTDFVVNVYTQNLLNYMEAPL